MESVFIPHIGELTQTPHYAILGIMQYLTRAERARLLLADSTTYINLLQEADLDRLLANLAKRPILPDTVDHLLGQEESRAISALLRSRYKEDGERRDEPDDWA